MDEWTGQPKNIHNALTDAVEWWKHNDTDLQNAATYSIQPLMINLHI